MDKTLQKIAQEAIVKRERDDAREKEDCKSQLQTTISRIIKKELVNYANRGEHYAHIEVDPIGKCFNYSSLLISEYITNNPVVEGVKLTPTYTYRSVVTFDWSK